MAGMGIKEIKTRSGTSRMADADLRGVMPVIALQARVGSLVLFGVESIEATIVTDKKNLVLKAKGEIRVMNKSLALDSLAWVLADCEDGDLRLFDDLTTMFLKHCDGEISPLTFANDHFFRLYSQHIQTFPELAKDVSTNLEAQNVP